MTKTPPVSVPVDWHWEARQLLRAQLAHKEMGYQELSLALQSIGIDESPKVLSNKINRGTFSLSFYLQCMRAMDIKTIKLTS